MTVTSQDLTDANARLAQALAAYRASEATDKQALTDANTAELQQVTDLTDQNAKLQAIIDAGGTINAADLQTHFNETQALIDSFTVTPLPKPPVVLPVAQ